MKYSFASVAALALAFGGCASEGTTPSASNNTNLGNAEALLTLPSGFVINTVDFTVTDAAGAVVRQDDVNVANSSRLRFRIGNLQIATGYSISLSATANDGTTTVPCAGAANFDINNNQVTSLDMRLICANNIVVDRDERGDLIVNVAVEQNNVRCPVVTGITALPLETAVGSDLELEGHLSGAPFDSVAWAGPGGTFGNAASATTLFTCAAPGLHNLTFSVSSAACTGNTEYESLRSFDVEVECTGTPADAATPTDADVVVPTLTDADVVVPTPTDADVELTPTDADVVVPTPTDADVELPPTAPDAAFLTTTSCGQCIDQNCRAFLDIDFVTPCFLENPESPFDTEVQPLFSQRCVDVVVCSITASDRCAANEIIGPAPCYCGSEDINTCFGNAGPAADSQCADEWAAATPCSPTDFSCIGGEFQSFIEPAGFAFAIIDCANTNCATACNL